MSKVAEQLAKDLLENLKSLADRIARKPPEFDPLWAKSIIEAFSLYPRTSTVNYFVSLGDCLREFGWPFPAYLDLKNEMRRSNQALSFVKWPFPFYQLFSLRSISNLMLNFSPTESQSQKFIDWFLSRRFHKASKKVFAFWKAHPLLESKKQVFWIWRELTTPNFGEYVYHPYCL